MLAVAEAMTEDSAEHARYTTCKIDVDVMPIVKAAAAFAGKTVQEWVSDHLNVLAAKETARKPVKRKPPPPRRAAE